MKWSEAGGYETMVAIIQGASAVATVTLAIFGGCTYHSQELKLESIKELESNTKELFAKANLYEKILATEAGSRESYIELRNGLYAEANKHHSSTNDFMIQRMYSAIQKYDPSDIGKNEILVAYTNIVIPTGCENLNSNILRIRLQALATIFVSKDYRCIPMVEKVAETDPDLNAVQLALHIIQDAVHVSMEKDVAPYLVVSLEKCLFETNEFKKDFDEWWKVFGSKMPVKH